MFLYRIEKEEHRHQFPPKGSLYFGGRWHKAGMWVVYTSETIALAKLETLANSSFLPSNRLLRIIELKDTVKIKTLSRDELPPSWNEVGGNVDLANFTQKAIGEGYLAMRVPSVLSPLENNVLLFPDHSEFNTLAKPADLLSAYFDVRLRQASNFNS